jgi:hypothetical protein
LSLGVILKVEHLKSSPYDVPIPMEIIIRLIRDLTSLVSYIGHVSLVDRLIYELQRMQMEGVPAGLYGSETCSLTGRKHNTFSVFENRVLTMIC